jgi:hypothetical protein
MFNSQLGQALFKILPGEVSSSITYQDSQRTETWENHALDHSNGFLCGSFTTWHGVTPAFLASNKSPNKSRVFSKLSR